MHTNRNNKRFQTQTYVKITYCCCLIPGRTYGATEIKVHPHFKFTPQADRYDVAVVRLNRPVDFAPHISPICLPPKDMSMNGMHGWATGWGALKPGSSLRPKTLQVRESKGWPSL